MEPTKEQIALYESLNKAINEMVRKNPLSALMERHNITINPNGPYLMVSPCGDYLYSLTNGKYVRLRKIYKSA